MPYIDEESRTIFNQQIVKPYWYRIQCVRDMQHELYIFNGDRIDSNGIMRVSARQSVVGHFISHVSAAFVYRGKFWNIGDRLDFNTASTVIRCTLDMEYRVKRQALRLYREVTKNGNARGA